MEETKDNAPARKDQPTADAAKDSREVTVKATVSGQTTSKSVRFNTPILLKEVQALDDSASVEIVSTNTRDGEEPQTLLKGTKAEAVEALEKSIVRPDDIAAQFQRLVRFLVDHSTLKAVGVEFVCTDDAGEMAGAGFVSTTPDCTTAQAIALVNCGDVNIDEFVNKAKLSVPGRDGAGKNGVIVTPTAEEVRKLG